VTETEAAVREFLSNARTVYDEYDQGYMDADAALTQLEKHVESLESTVED
jgi:hypothetical protein